MTYNVFLTSNGLIVAHSCNRDYAIDEDGFIYYIETSDVLLGIIDMDVPDWNLIKDKFPEYFI